MIAFHRLLIGTAGLFFLMLGVREFLLWYAGQGGVVTLALGAGSTAAAALLAYYFFNLERFVGRRIVRHPPDHGASR